MGVLVSVLVRIATGSVVLDRWQDAWRQVLNSLLGKAFAEVVATPAKATSPGDPGQIAYDAGHLYVCVARDAWTRTSLSPW
jgi:hypothetical protein